MSNPVYRALLLAQVSTNGAAFFDRLFRQNWYGNTLTGWVDGLNIAPGSDILELGCGPGNLSHYLADAGQNVTGADKSAKMIKWANRHGGKARFVQANALDLDMADDSFDVILLSSLLNIIPDRASLLVQAARVLRPGGTISALFPIAEFDKTRAADISEKLNLSGYSRAAISLWASVAGQLNPGDTAQEMIAAGFQDPRIKLHLQDSIASVTATRSN